MKILLFLFILQNIFYEYQFKTCKFWHKRGQTYNFEYGVNYGQIAFSILGVIQVLGKPMLRVPIDIEECKMLVYVQVETQNSLGPPHVWVNWQESAVELNYRNLMLGDSCYNIVAKTMPIRDCNGSRNMTRN